MARRTGRGRGTDLHGLRGGGAAQRPRQLRARRRGGAPGQRRRRDRHLALGPVLSSAGRGQQGRRALHRRGEVRARASTLPIRSPASRRRAASATTAISKSCDGVAPADINSPCDGAAASDRRDDDLRARRRAAERRADDRGRVHRRVHHPALGEPRDLVPRRLRSLTDYVPARRGAGTSRPRPSPAPPTSPRGPMHRRASLLPPRGPTYDAGLPSRVHSRSSIADAAAARSGSTAGTGDRRDPDASFVMKRDGRDGHQDRARGRRDARCRRR